MDKQTRRPYPNATKEKAPLPVKDEEGNARLFNRYITPNLDYVRSLVEHYSYDGSDVDYNYSMILERFYRYIGEYDENRSLKTWIHVCVKGGMHRLNGQYVKEKEKRTGLDLGSVARTVANIPTSAGDGQQSLIDSLPDEVYKALLVIPVCKLSPFLLYVQGYDIREIAQMEFERGHTPEYAEAMVKTRILSARKKLKELLKDYATRR